MGRVRSEGPSGRGEEVRAAMVSAIRLIRGADRGNVVFTVPRQASRR